MEKKERKLINNEKKKTKETLYKKREEYRILDKNKRKDIHWKDMDAAAKKNYWKKHHSSVDLEWKKLRLKIKKKKRKRIRYKYI